MMLCQTTTLEKAHLLKNHIIELKIDGTRVLIKNGQLYNRNLQNITYKYPELAEDLKKLKDYVLDGEICILDNGFPNFNLLLKRNCEDRFKIKLQARKNPATLFLFDLLKSHKDLTKEPLFKRQELLKKLINAKEFSHIRFIQQFATLKEGWDYVKRHNLEGLILKDRYSKYFMNTRSHYWLKLKNFKEAVMEFSLYEDQPAGIVLKTPEDKIRVTVNGRQAEEVKRIIEEQGKVKVVVQYLSKTEEGKLRFPSFKEVVVYANNIIR